MLNDEVPDPDEDGPRRGRGEFDDITPEDFVRGSQGGDPPGWLQPGELVWLRAHMPVPYVQIVPVRTDELGRVSAVGVLLRVGDGGVVERELIAGRVLFHETLREAIARNIAKDLGELALPSLPQTMTPFTVAEFFPTPGVGDCYDARQHAIALCYVVPISGDCSPCDETLDVAWMQPDSPQLQECIASMSEGTGRIVRQALAWCAV